MRAGVSGLGIWLPSRVRTNAEWPADYGVAQRGDRTFNDIPLPAGKAARVAEQHLLREQADPFLGVRERRVAAESMTSVEAELYAAQAALTDAGLSPEQLDAVVSYSMVPDSIMPSTAAAVAGQLGIGHATTFGVEAACASSLTQLSVAKALIESGQAEHVLLTQSHLILRTFPMLHPAAAGLGDCASACVVSAGGRWPIVLVHSVTHGEYCDAVTWVRDAPGDATPWWRPGSDLRMGSRNRLQAKQLMRDTLSFAVQTIREALDRARIPLSEVASIFSVQPRGWIPGGIAELLGFEKARAPTTYETLGHLGASGPLVNWHAALRSGQRQSGTHWVLYGQGAGFTRAAAIVETGS